LEIVNFFALIQFVLNNFVLNNCGILDDSYKLFVGLLETIYQEIFSTKNKTLDKTEIE